MTQYSLSPFRNPPFTRVSETLRPRHRQPFAVQVQVHQRKAGAQPMMVLLNPAVSHLLETEDALQYPEGMFHLRSHSGLHPVLAFLTRPQSSCSTPSGWSYLVLRSRTRPPDRFSLSLISTVPQTLRSSPCNKSGC